MTRLCQGPKCHTYDTQDRKRGPKGNKRNQTRTIKTYARIYNAIIDKQIIHIEYSCARIRVEEALVKIFNRIRLHADI